MYINETCLLYVHEWFSQNIEYNHMIIMDLFCISAVRFTWLMLGLILQDDKISAFFLHSILQ